MRPTSLRHCLERLFFTLEPVLTAFLYPWYLLRRRWGKPRVPILMYHQVGRPVPGVQACEECVSPEQFERQVQAIVDAGYRVLTLSQLAALISSHSAAPLERSVVLTFDDGLRGQFVNAYPALRRHGLPATFFPVAGYVGRNVFLPHLGIDESRVDATAGPVAEWRTISWEEAAQMSRNGIEIGCHSLTHRSMGTVPPAEIDAEVQRSKRMLEHQLRIRVGVFAYPFGSQAYGDCGRDVRERLRSRLVQHLRLLVEHVHDLVERGGRGEECVVELG